MSIFPPFQVNNDPTKEVNEVGEGEDTLTGGTFPVSFLDHLTNDESKTALREMKGIYGNEQTRFSM